MNINELIKTTDVHNLLVQERDILAVAQSPCHLPMANWQRIELTEFWAFRMFRPSAACLARYAQSWNVWISAGFRKPAPKLPQVALA